MDPHSCCDSPRVSSNRRRQRALIGAAILTAVVACGDPYLHTNPYDPGHPVQFAFTGPDTLFSWGEVGHYSVQVNPSWPDTGMVWGTSTFTNPFAVPAACGNQVIAGSTVLQSDSTGSYQSVAPPLEPDRFSVPISVAIGTIDTSDIEVICASADLHVVFFKVARHTGYKIVVVTQRLTRIQLRCPDTHACAPLAVGDSAFVWVDGFDALNNAIASLRSTSNPASGHPVATYLSRDSTIARATPIGVRVARVTAVASGSTWVVATRGALLDSLQIVVH